MQRLRNRVKVAAKGVLSLIALAVLGLGVPIALASGLGSPLPHHWPGWHALIRALGSGVSDAEIEKAAVELAWIAWAWFVAAVVREVIGHFRSWTRGSPGSGGRSRAPTLHGLANLLVGCAFSLATLAPHSSPAFAAVQAPQIAPASAPVGGSVRPAEYSVEAGDTLWSIAATRLGSPLAWPEIAHMNEGRQEPGGRVFADPSRIYPGWQIALPPSAEPSDQVLPESLPAPSAPPPPTRTAATIGNATAQPQGAPAAHSVAGEGGHRDHEPGRPQRSHEAASHAGSSRSGQVEHPGPLLPLGAGITGAAIAFALVRSRKLQARRRRPGRLIALPSGDAARFASRLAVPTGEARMEMLSSALCAYGELARLAPTLIGAVVSCDGVELALEEPSAAEFPFTTYAGCASWFATPGALKEFSEGGDFTNPAVVCVGAGDSGAVAVDLERAGSWSIHGEADRTLALLRSIGLSLATAPWSATCDVIVYGFGEELARHHRVTRLDSIEDVAAGLSEHARSAAEMLEEGTAPSAARAGEERYVLPAMVALVAGELRPDDLPPLVSAAAPGSSAVVVVAGPVPGVRAVIDLTASESRVTDLGVSFREDLIGDEDSRSIEELFDVAETSDDAGLEDAPYSSITAPDGAGEVEVAILGPVEFRGSDTPGLAKSVELVVYLLLHPRPVPHGTWATALWPEAVAADSTRHNTASRARLALGKSAAGTPRLSSGKLLSLDGVGSDWARFCDFATSSDPANWEAAVGLVRGKVCEDVVDADWLVTEGFRASIEASIVDTGVAAAESLLSSGEALRARATCRRVLSAVPYDERVWRVLLRAEHQVCGVGGVKATWREMTAVLEIEIEPEACVEAATRELYRQLVGRASLEGAPR